VLSTGIGLGASKRAAKAGVSYQQFIRRLALERAVTERFSQGAGTYLRR
jgi:hypothetical protein